MSGYAEQYESEMWEGVARSDAQARAVELERVHVDYQRRTGRTEPAKDPRSGRIDGISLTWEEERAVWEGLAAGTLKRAPAELWRAMGARYAGKCERCRARVRRGSPIRYTSHAPTGFKVLCEPCAGEVLS